MNVSRIDYLFNRPMQPGQRTRLIVVLTACCQAVKNRQSERAHFLPLTHDLNGVSIDEIMEQIPMDTNAPFLAFQKMYRIVEVYKTLKELHYLGYIDDANNDLEVITLTHTLFQAIAEEWAYERGARPFRIGDSKIFAPSLELAKVIYERRLALQKMREEVTA